MKLTKAQTKALTIIQEHQPIYPWYFSYLMWPDSDGHKHYHKCGPKGVCRGLGMALAAGGYLGKLVKKGLVYRYHKYNFFRDKYGSQSFFNLTNLGEQSLREQSKESTT